jgi:transcription elongation factor GreB
VSRAFVKEKGPVEALVVPRAPLPPGQTNYVTPSGLAALRREREELELQRGDRVKRLDSPADAAEYAALGARLAELDARIQTAVLVDPATQARDEARFGATVTVRTERNELRRYRIVGVDEANGAAGRVAFVAPVARALLGKHAGDVAVLRTPHGEEELEVVDIAYDAKA